VNLKFRGLRKFLLDGVLSIAVILTPFYYLYEDIMDFNHLKTDKFSFVLYENIYDDEELQTIYKECIFLCDEKKLELTANSGAARDKEGNLLKTNKGLFLEDIYSEPMKFSNYLRLSSKQFEYLPFSELNEKDNNFEFFSKNFYNTRTLFSYYQDNDYYLTHRDASEFTFIFWLFKEPKQFTGGDLILNDIDYRVEIKNNSGILFPSKAMHTVEPVIMKDKTPFNRMGRFSYSTFIY
jgi:Rps23 Pro-64 3,4-dihydroxylase Tpa1-like proline 4-hydroxylase